MLYSPHVGAESSHNLLPVAVGQAEDLKISPPTSLRYAQGERLSMLVRAERNPEGEVEA